MPASRWGRDGGLPTSNFRIKKQKFQKRRREIETPSRLPSGRTWGACGTCGNSKFRRFIDCPVKISADFLAFSLSLSLFPGTDPATTATAAATATATATASSRSIIRVLRLRSAPRLSSRVGFLGGPRKFSDTFAASSLSGSRRFSSCRCVARSRPSSEEAAGLEELLRFGDIVPRSSFHSQG
ncbi:hypothetical protein NL676_035409 [Syzygium grande]|nr:hypothetical protein NL676_035409 [Syzygium grande]